MNSEKETAREVFNSLKDLSVTELGRYRESVRFLRRATQDRQDLAYYRSLEARISLSLRESQLLAFGETESGEGLRGAAKLCRQTKGMSFEREALEKLEKELDNKFAVEVPQIEERLVQKVERHGFNFGKIRQAAATALAPLVIFAGIQLAGILNRKYDSETPSTSRPVSAVEIDNKSKKEQVIYQAPEPVVEVEKITERLDIPDGSVVEINGPALGGNSLKLESKLMSRFPEDCFCLGIGGDNNLRILAIHNGDIPNGEGFTRLPGRYLQDYGANPGATMFLKVDTESERKLVAVDKFIIREDDFTSDPKKIENAARENGVELKEGDVTFITCCDYDVSTNSYLGKLIVIYRLSGNLDEHLAKR
ncbi:MAG: hypothetical protein ACOX50_02650 [Patescibacteria group bacterium]|jgi:hypothetical protein